jgi:hypothetical protein
MDNPPFGLSVERWLSPEAIMGGGKKTAGSEESAFGL